MSLVLDSVETRIVDILENARGGASPYSSTAQSISIPVGWFRRSADNAALDAEAYPVDMFDRAYHLEWVSSVTVPSPRNTADGYIMENHELHVNLGFMAGAAGTGFVALAPSTSETAATAANNARKRGLSTAYMVQLALTFPELYQAVEDPTIVDIRTDDAPITVRELPEGRVIVTVPLTVVLYSANATTHYYPAT